MLTLTIRPYQRECPAAVAGFYANLTGGPCVTNKVITGGAALMLYQR